MTIIAVALGDSFAFPLSFGACVAVSGAVAVGGTGGGFAVADISSGRGWSFAVESGVEERVGKSLESTW